jgi:hypothetical protein
MEDEMSTREYVMVVSEMSRMMHDGLIDEEDAANETFLLSEMEWRDYFG